MYVNYAMVEDFIKLREMNISVAGHIVIAKYGKIYRGDKVSAFTNYLYSFSVSSPDWRPRLLDRVQQRFLNMNRKRERVAAVTNAGSPSILHRGLNLLVLCTKIMAFQRQIDSLRS